MALNLYRHNAEAYKRVTVLLSSAGKTAVIHPTGTGKSFIAFKMIEEHPDWRVLWLSPSRYISETQCANLLQEAPEFDLDRVRFMTYAKLILLTDEELGQIGCDCIVLDEFHRCGAEQWGQGVGRLFDIYPSARCLGLTATSIRYLDAGRNMADELFRECIASEMTLGEAIVRGILPVPEYVTSVYRYNEELEAYQQRIDLSIPVGLKAKAQKQLERLRRSLAQAEQLDKLFERHMKKRHGKYIVFCSSWEHLQEVKSRLREWFRRVDDAPHCYTLYSGDADTEKDFEAFCEDQSEHLKLMLCINRLNEGIHIADLSGVILFRPTVSPIIYKQQVGRALTAGGEKPVIFDIVGNFENLLSIGSIQYEMTEAVKKLRADSRAEEITVERFGIDGRTTECLDIIRQLEKSINSPWEDYYEAARQYSETNGNLLMPRRYTTEDGLQLGAWIWAQRRMRKMPGQGMLTPEQIERLDEIGMIWSGMHEYSWNKAYEEARSYYETNGNLDVGVNYKTESGFALGVWLNNQRQKVGENSQGRKLTEEQVERLDKIGMIWEARSQSWEAHYEEAKAYYEEHGNLDIPSAYRTEDGFLLGMWLIYQKKVSLEKHQKELLEKIGMRWDSSHDRKWMRSYQAAKTYYEMNGHLNVPYSYKTAEGLALGRWIRKQREAKNHSKHCNFILNDERIRMLDALNISWNIKESNSNVGS